jgi:hypothetical protein
MANRLGSFLTASALVLAAGVAHAQPPNAAGPKRDALGFVKAAAPSGHYTVGRWTRPICVRVIGLEPQQTQAVRTRVEEVARQFGIDVQVQGCQRANVEIGFTENAQGMVNSVAKTGLLGDTNVKTVSHAIQSWYQTNGRDGDPLINASAPPEAAARTLLNAMVIVDVSRAQGKSLTQLADYATLLALSEHSSDDRCSALPSVGELFAGPCPGRAAPKGLTPADNGYLSALYQWTDKGIIEPSNASAVAGRMAAILGGAQLASRGPAPASPASSPVRPGANASGQF